MRCSNALITPREDPYCHAAGRLGAEWARRWKLVARGAKTGKLLTSKAVTIYDGQDPDGKRFQIANRPEVELENHVITSRATSACATSGWTEWPESGENLVGALAPYGKSNA